jgi:hypothetical protein
MLRVGVILDSYTSSAWVAEVIKEIQSSGFAQVELAILNDYPAQEDALLKTKFRDQWMSRLFHAYEQWDLKRNRGDHNALEPADVSSLLHGIPLVSVHFDSNVFVDSIPEDKLTEIRDGRLDILLHFGSSVLRGGILSVARYGIWSFRYGDRFGNRGGPALLWELIQRSPVSRSALEILTESLEGGQVIYESYSSTDQISLYCSRNPIYWKTAEFALRRLRDLDTRGIEYIRSLPAYYERGAGVRSRKRTQSALHVFFFMGRHVTRWLQARVASLRPGSDTRWYIGIRRKTADRNFNNPANYRLMRCPKDRFYADPFLFEKDGRTFLFFEDFRYAEGRAVICCSELDPEGKPGLPIEVLRRPYHLSYPFVFEHEGEVYMVPETKGNRMVELYRATSFPTAWASEAVLLDDIYAVDATIQQVNGKFWMFAGVSNGRYSNSDELSLFYADALRGPWIPHRHNPVVSDVRRSRPAGMLFYDEGRLIRPSQDCGKAYGYALEFSEVLTLSETEYEERPIGRLDPEQVAGCVGTHTYNRTKQFEVVDRTISVKIGDAEEGAQVRS